ncbi:MAG: hypothetical protein H6765_10100 [Candidatus Peribacteria bacterium]|nr:MAG: hypothetical protein H6765_10100 [Candidatus Peribacteria bacterium]
MTYRKFGPIVPGDIATIGIYDFPAEKGVATINGESVPYGRFTLRDGEL